MYLIISNNNEPGTLDTLPKTEGLEVIKEDEFKLSDVNFNDQTKFAITSEAVIDSVNLKTTSQNKLKATALLKDKVLFRQTISDLYSNYDFFNVKLDELPFLNVTKKMVVKPRKGFFGTGIRVIDQKSNLYEVKESLAKEIEHNSKSFANSEAILSADELLVEDYIEGQEYAVDMFYDANGDVQLLNIYGHPKPKKEAYIHALYCSSKSIYETIAPRAIEFFTKLNTILQVKNYVIHGEFKLNGNVFLPIEMNPSRLGGMGLGNMCYYALGVNPYEYIIKDKAPNWDLIWSKKEHVDAVYNFLIAYNGVNIDLTNMKPNITKLKNDLGEVLNEVVFDYQKGLVFGIFTSKETEVSMQKLTEIDFDNYFELI